MKKRKVREPWKRDLDLLTSRLLSKYDDALEVLRLLRRGMDFDKARKQVGITKPTARKYIGSAIKIKGNKIVPKATDNLLRKMRIYENGREVWIQVRGLKNASIIGQYHSAVGRLVDRNERNALEVFKKITILDDKGRKHRLDTNRKNIFDIFDRREAPESFEIYYR
ncbi:MAG: hypothetical protein ACYDAJ_06895 [Nitrosotalea sp.]